MKITVKVDIEIPEEFYDTYLNFSDLFRTDYCGYWLRSIKRVDNPGGTPDHPNVRHRLVYDVGAEDRVPTDEEDIKAIAKMQAGKKLPKNYYILNRDVMTKAFAEGVKTYGLEFYEKHDAGTLDCAIQTALLGSVVYG